MCVLIGPLPNTLPDFWQMVWEQKCEIIVMLTGLVEGGKVTNLKDSNYKLLIVFSVQIKCTQYWPEPQDGTLEYGSIEVKLVSQKYHSFYTYTTLEISQVQAFSLVCSALIFLFLYRNILQQIQC